MAEQHPTHEIESRFAERLARLEAREREAWSEYLEACRRCPEYAYAQAEPLAWRRLRRTLAELAHDRRRTAFARDRALAEAAGYRLAG